MALRHIEFVVGVVLLCGAMALVYMSLRSSGVFDRASAPYRLQARFEQIGGLRPQAPVKAAGVVVGRVRGIRYDGAAGIAVVEIDMDARYRFPADTRVSIRNAGLLGEQHLALSPGSASTQLSGGHTISRTQSALVLEDLVGRLLYDKAQASSTGH